MPGGSLPGSWFIYLFFLLGIGRMRWVRDLSSVSLGPEGPCPPVMLLSLKLPHGLLVQKPVHNSLTGHAIVKVTPPMGCVKYKAQHIVLPSQIGFRLVEL